MVVAHVEQQDDERYDEYGRHPHVLLDVEVRESEEIGRLLVERSGGDADAARRDQQQVVATPQSTPKNIAQSVSAG